MFYGVALKPGQTVTVSPQDGGEVLHLSQVCMPHAKDNGKTYVQVTQDGKTFSICMLQKDSQESSQLDLFLSTRQGLSLKVEGAKNEVHVTGYFEPSGDLGESSDEESDDEEVAAEEMMEVKRVVPKKGGKIEELDRENEDDEDEEEDDDEDASSSAKPLLHGSGEEDDEDDDEDDDDDDEGEANGIESGSEDEEEEEDDEEQHQQQAKGDKKRKAQESNVSATAAAGKGAAANKKPKTAGGPQQKQQQGSTGGDANTYKNSLIEYLKKNGKTPLATLGQKVKKPAGVSEKMAHFLKSHANTFDVSNGFCALKA